MESGLRERRRIWAPPPLGVPRLRGNDCLYCPARLEVELRTGEPVNAAMDLEVEPEPTS
jgi:hypothetical protein